MKIEGINNMEEFLEKMKEDIKKKEPEAFEMKEPEPLTMKEVKDIVEALDKINQSHSFKRKLELLVERWGLTKEKAKELIPTKEKFLEKLDQEIFNAKKVFNTIDTVNSMSFAQCKSNYLFSLTGNWKDEIGEYIGFLIDIKDGIG